MRDVIFKIINQFIKGVDTYYNNGSMWLIFTDDKKWVIELTKDGDLWYNFYFFQDCFKYLSLDVVENQHYITEWVESIIQNGVRSTKFGLEHQPISVDYAIQNGVRETLLYDGFINFSVEDVIKNGIKEINHCSVSNDENAKNAIEFGIKETHEDAYHNKGRVEGVIENGIKETKGLGPSEVTTKEIEKVIKETIELPDKSGELNGYGEYYARQKNMTYPHTDIVNDVITDGIKYIKK